MYTRDPRPIPPRVMASSAMRVQLGGLRVFADRTRKNKSKTKCVHDLLTSCSGLRLFDFMLRSQYMQVTYASDKPQLFWLWENLKTPNAAPCQDQDGPGSWISGVYLWFSSTCRMLSWGDNLHENNSQFIKVHLELTQFPTQSPPDHSLSLARTALKSSPSVKLCFQFRGSEYLG